MARFEPHPSRRPALVTGASSGIGEAVARALAAAGHPVVLGARRQQRCEEVAARLREQGGEAVAIRLDLSDPDSVKRFAVSAEDAVGPAEVLVSNAGDTLPATAVETDPDAFAAQVQVNLLGAQRLVHFVTPAMIGRRRGDVIFVTSDVMIEPRPRMSSYVTAKWGLEGLARAMQMELEGTGVRVSTVRPGPTASGMGGTWDPPTFARVLEDWERFGLARHDHFLRPEAVADAVAYVVGTPPGTHIRAIEIQPEAPIRLDGPGHPKREER
jgi:NADP-dependent 3-hydroxy acid dehydrogenase YdfG